MGQGLRVTVDAAMRARDVSRMRPQDEAPRPPDETPLAEGASQPVDQQKRGRRGEKRRLAKRRAAKA